MPQRCRRRGLRGRRAEIEVGQVGGEGGWGGLGVQLTFAGAPEPRVGGELLRTTGAARVRHLQDVPVVAGHRSCQQREAEQGAQGCAQEQGGQKGHTGKSQAAAG